MLWLVLQVAYSLVIANCLFELRSDKSLTYIRLIRIIAIPQIFFLKSSGAFLVVLSKIVDHFLGTGITHIVDEDLKTFERNLFSKQLYTMEEVYVTSFLICNTIRSLVWKLMMLTNYIGLNAAKLFPLVIEIDNLLTEVWKSAFHFWVAVWTRLDILYPFLCNKSKPTTVVSPCCSSA